MAAAPRARWAIIEDDLCGEQPLVIKDVGPWNKHPTITNDAVAVVAHLLSEGELATEQKLYYFDSEGELSELVHDGQKFIGYRPVPEGVAERFQQ